MPPALDWRRRNFQANLVLFLFLLCLSGMAVQAEVIISEFMAGNLRTLTDSDGEYSDWVELYNTGNDPVNLGGWYLSDNPADLRKWRFPSVTLLPYRALVVFASEKNRALAGAELHTSFKLTLAGEFLALIKPDGKTIASAYAPQFPAQTSDISYGVPMQQTVATLIASDAPV